MLEAAEFAASRCRGWSFATSNDRYDVNGLLALAETSDSEDPIDEDSFYVVLPPEPSAYATMARTSTGCF
jgi:hypothetical protein